jgi:hypothetical protein
MRPGIAAYDAGFPFGQQVNLIDKTPASLISLLSTIVYFDAFAWLVGMGPTLYYAFSQGRLPTFGGIYLLGGPFEKLGIEALIVAGIGYIMVSALKILAGYWLSNSRMDGAILEIILLGLSAIFWFGFALPLGPLFGIIQVVLLVLAWRNLR